MMSAWAAQTGKHLLQTQNVSEQNQKHFLCPQQMLRARANGETFVSATMCPQQCVLICRGLQKALQDNCYVCEDSEMRKLKACYLWFLGPVWDVKFSGADRVVTCGDDGTIRLWDSWSTHCIAILSGHLDAVLSISLRQITGYFMKTLE